MGVLLECNKALVIPEFFDFALSKSISADRKWRSPAADLSGLLACEAFCMFLAYCSQLIFVPQRTSKCQLRFLNSKIRQSACTLNIVTMTDISDPWSL